MADPQTQTPRDAPMLGRCTNCGAAMKEASNENWSVYCGKPECQKVAIEAVLRSVRGFDA